MFADSDPSGDPSRDPIQSALKPLDPDNPEPKPHLFRDSGGAAPKGGASTSAPQELTFSYLCDHPKLPLHEKDRPAAGDLFSSLEISRAKGKEIAPDSPADENRRWVEKDFLQLSGGKREDLERLDPESREKKVKVETLNLSLGPNLSLSLNSSNPAGPSVAATTSALPPSAPTPVLPKRTYSANTQTMNSDDYAASLSYSYSVPFSHNPSCSLTRCSTENYDFSRENDQIWHAGEGTNGSVHSRFRPIGDGNSIAFTNPGGYAHISAGNNKDPNNNSLDRANSSENVSFFPHELPARQVKGNAVMSSDSRRNAMLSRPDHILREIISESVPVMAQILKDLPNESLEALRGSVRNVLEAPEKKDEFASLQRKLVRRSDLTYEILLKAHKTQLEIFLAIKTGVAHFISGKTRVAATELAEMFLLTRCRNLNCKSVLPVDDCDCKICSTKDGFCSNCMCPVCLKFDCAANTCSWVGCDVCSHWCHASCGLERSLIRPGPTLKGPMGTTEMQFQCLGCGHASEMFGFVKEVFKCCAKDWTPEVLMKELDCVRKIFCASEDFEGKGLHAKAAEVFDMLGKRLVSPVDACDSMLQFFKYGVTEFSVTGCKTKSTATAQASHSTDVHPRPSPTPLAPLNPSFNFRATNFILNTQTDAVETNPKPLTVGSHSSQSKEDDDQSLETIVKCKEAEAKLFQKLADDAWNEVESYRQIARAKSEKLEEEYTTKLAKLCLQEAEEKRRKQLEELKSLENSHCDYQKMKMRMQAEIASLLERMEATKKLLV